MKKLLAILLAAMMLLACAIPAMADEGSEPNWTEYDALIARPTSSPAKPRCTRPRTS